MVRVRLAVWWSFVPGLLGSACAIDLDANLDGLACRAEDPRCLPGYVCSADNRCVHDDGAAVAAGAGGDGSAGRGSGNGGSTAGAGGAPGRGGNGPTVSDAGAPGASNDAGGSGFRYDAGPGLDALDASALPDAAGCETPVDLYRDEDEDGFGVGSQHVYGCAAADKWALVAGDCRDDLKDVHPEQLQFFSVGYPDSTRPQAGNVSFDYDCSTQEEPATGVVAAPNCNELLTCEGAGYAPVNPARTGPGVNGICGSTELVSCQANAVPLLGLTCNAQPLAGGAAAGCR